MWVQSACLTNCAAAETPSVGCYDRVFEGHAAGVAPLAHVVDAWPEFADLFNACAEGFFEDDSFGASARFSATTASAWVYSAAREVNVEAATRNVSPVGDGCLAEVYVNFTR